MRFQVQFYVELGRYFIHCTFFRGILEYLAAGEQEVSLKAVQYLLTFGKATNYIR